MNSQAGPSDTLERDSPYAGLGEKRYPNSVLDEVVVSQAARELAADLHNEARYERITAIIELYLRDARGCE